MSETDQLDKISEEIHGLEREQQRIAEDWTTVSNRLDNGDIDFGEAAYLQSELKNAAESNNAMLAQLHHEQQVTRAKALRTQIPGWDEEAGFKAGAQRLIEYLDENGFPQNYIATAKPADLIKAEKARQKAQGGPTDFDMAEIAQESGKKYKANMKDYEQMSKDLGISARELKAMSDEKLEFYTKDLGPVS